jgi:hypothetical protein
MLFTGYILTYPTFTWSVERTSTHKEHVYESRFHEHVMVHLFTFANNAKM